jgi:hypothetical protein
MNPEPTTEIVQPLTEFDVIQGTPSEAEARKALVEIGAVTTIESIKAMQVVGSFMSHKIRFPEVALTRTVTCLEEVDLIKKHAKTMMQYASGEMEGGAGVIDVEMGSVGAKILTGALMVEERLLRLALVAAGDAKPALLNAKAPRKLRSPKVVTAPTS